jgi:uncharacterized membrane protein YciS (DUF1049 family)
MTDQFPTLEAAATLGFAVMLWRAVLLGREATAIVGLSHRLEDELAKGDLDAALHWCNRAASSRFAPVARRALMAAYRSPPGRHAEARDRITDAVRSECAVLSRQGRAGRARDLVVLAVLGGAALYGLSAEVGFLFIAMCAGGAVLNAVSFWLRHRVSALGERAAKRLVSQAADAAAARPPVEKDAGRLGTRGMLETGNVLECPRCGSREFVALQEPIQLSPVLDADATAPDRRVLVHDARTCLGCGHLVGRIEDVTSLTAFEAHQPSS